MSTTMCVVNGVRLFYPTNRATSEWVERRPRAELGGDSIVFLTGRTAVDPGTGFVTQFPPRRNDPRDPMNPDKFVFREGTVDPLLPIFREIYGEAPVGVPGPAGEVSVHVLRGITSVQRTVRSDVEFTPPVGSTFVRTQYFMVTDSSGAFEFRYDPALAFTERNDPRARLAWAFTSDDYRYVTGAGEGDPALIYDPVLIQRGRAFHPTSARRLANGQVLMANRMAGNDRGTDRRQLGGDIFVLDPRHFWTMFERAALGLPPYLPTNVATHGWRPDDWVQSMFAGNIPNVPPQSLLGPPSIRWRVPQPRRPGQPPTTVIGGVGAGNNPLEVFNTYNPQQPTYADLTD